MKRVLLIILLLALVAILGYFAWYYKASGVEEHGVALQEKPGFRAVHWHANLRILVCGQERKVPVNKGEPLLHTHRDANLIHVEGLIQGSSDVTLGKFMDAVGVPFSQTQVFDAQNGERCPDGTIGAWKMAVNGTPSAEFREYEIKDGDEIELNFNQGQ